MLICSQRFLRFTLAMGTVSVLATGCDRFAKESQIDRTFEPAKIKSVKGVSAAKIRGVIAARLDGARPKPITETQWSHAKTLYEDYDGNPLWLDGDGLRERRTKTLMTALLNADADALALDAYPLEELRRVLSELRDAKEPTPELLADVDLALTTTYVMLGEDLLTGQVSPSSVSQDWHIEPTPAQIGSALDRYLQDREFDVSMTRMRPEYNGYSALQKELERYRQISARGGWQPLPEGKTVKPGDPIPAVRLQALRDRLRLEGYLTDDSASAPRAGGRAVYDREIAGAVALFQLEHGIVVDSALGAETVQSLNLPAEYRLGQIAANMERYRWMPRTPGDRYVLVNVPAFQLEAFENGAKAMEMKVIVGAEYENRNTPAFSDSMQYVVFRPYWNATDNIMENELWPKVGTDPTFLERNNYEVVTEGGKQRIRQRPGEKNALGLVKFMFPNTFDIYMHDTPEEELFDKDVRAFSHGCIRLEQPEKMAEWVLGWSPERVQKAMQTGPDDRHVNLDRKVPVYIVYFTTYTRDGRLYFGNDLYNRDAALVERVRNGAQPTVAAVEAVKALRELAED
jgi:murein L,D-transpeptidase YcbB/YkuD